MFIGDQKRVEALNASKLMKLPDDFTVRPLYSQALKDTYKSKVQAVDFGNKTLTVEVFKK